MSTQKNLIKHLTNAPRYAFIEAHKQAETSEERAKIERVAEALGVRVEWASIYAHRTRIKANAPLDDIYTLFETLTETEKEIYIEKIINEAKETKKND